MKKPLFSLLLLFACFYLTAQNAEDIVSKHLNARGGIALDSIRNTRMEIALTFKNMPAMKSNLVYHTVMLQSHRMDTEVFGLYNLVICFSGNSAWQQLLKDGNTDVQRIDSAEIRDLKYQTEILGPLHHYKEKGYSIAYMGQVKVNDSETWQIQVNAANNTTYQCFIDTTTYSEVKRSVLAPSLGKMIEVSLYFSNYQPVKGVMMPFKIEMHNRKGISIFDYTKIELNIPMDQQLFEMPAK